MTKQDTIMLDCMARRWATTLSKTTHLPYDDIYQQAALCLLEARASGVHENRLTLAAYRDLLDYLRLERRRRVTTYAPSVDEDENDTSEIASECPTPEDICMAKETWDLLSPHQQETLLDRTSPPGDKRAALANRIYKRRSRARLAIQSD